MRFVELIFVLSVMAILAITDLKNRKIPNSIILPTIGLVFFLQIVQLHFENIWISFVGFAILFILYTINSNLIAGGDIKLIFLMTLVFGSEIDLIVLNSIVYFIMAISILFVIEKITKIEQTIPLGTVLFLGTITTLVLGGIQ